MHNDIFEWYHMAIQRLVNVVNILYVIIAENEC
jgi:hypothetical protein